MKLFQLSLIIVYFVSTIAIQFKDVSTQVGLRRPYGRRLKYGGSTVADLDGDGWPDIMVGHHDHMYADIYFNDRRGNFVRAKWRYWRDLHSLNPFRATTQSKGMSFISSVGGNYGGSPRAPALFLVTDFRNIRKISDLNFARGRGRSSVPLNLRKSQPAKTDVMIFNFPLFKKKMNVFAGAVRSQTSIQHKHTQGFGGVENSYGMAIDVDMDGKMELLSYHTLKIHKVVGDYKLRDISNFVLPKFQSFYDNKGIVSVCELDYDNDGKMDLYVSRSGTNDLIWLRPHLSRNPSDYLLRNVGGRYQDVTNKAKIPKAGESRGVTCGDFNNDGHIDILVSQFIGKDRLLLNNGDGTFRSVRPGFSKGYQTRGDHPVAVDYNRDGQLDVILTEGHWFQKPLGGFLRVLKNKGNSRNWLLCRVGNSPTNKTTSLHALVTVKTTKFSMIRRVGSPGSTTSNSNIELVHFGLGGYPRSLKVTVKWIDGSQKTMYDVPSRQIVVFGII